MDDASPLSAESTPHRPATAAVAPATEGRDDPGAPDDADLAGVAAVVASLDRLTELPVAEHVAVFETAHERLQAALADASAQRS